MMTTPAPHFPLLLAEHRRQAVLLALLLVLLAAGAFVAEVPALPIVAIVGAAALTWIVFSPARLFLALLGYIYLLPNYSAFEKYKFFPFYVRTDAVIAGVVALLGVWLVGYLTFRWNKHRWLFMDWAMLALLSWAVLAFFWGGANGASMKTLGSDLFFLCLFAVYFPLRFGNLSERHLQKYWLLLSWLAVVVSAEYIMLSLAEKGIASFIINRVSTQQPHVAQLALPYFTGFLFLPYPRWKKLLAVPAILLLLAMVFLSQQRALWLTAALSVILFGALIYLRGEISMGRILRFFGMVIFMLVSVILLLLLLDKLFSGGALTTLAWRISTFENLARDQSLLIRLHEISRAMTQWQQSPLLGAGLGATIEPLNAGHLSPYLVDNSYAYLLWKTGLIGLAVFSVIIVLPMWHGVAALRRASHFQQHHLLASLLAGWCGLLLIALTNTCLVRYVYILLWSFVLVTFELANERMRDGR